MDRLEIIIGGIAAFVAIIGTVIAYLQWRHPRSPESGQHSLESPSPELSALGLYEAWRDGMSTPEENVRQIERIANSRDPRRGDYLMQAAALPDISELESEALTLALAAVQDNERVQGLTHELGDRERKRIAAGLPESDDPLLRPILMNFKLWRYVNRRSHPHFERVNEFIALVLVRGLNDEKTLKLSRELEAELE